MIPLAKQHAGMLPIPCPLPIRRGQPWHWLVMYIYVDDSEKGDFVCIAAFFSSDAGINGLHEQWSVLLKKHNLPHFHAEPFFTGSDDVYRSLVPDICERHKIIKEFCDLPKRYYDRAVGISTNARGLSRGV
jgi:hypothetical protein